MREREKFLFSLRLVVARLDVLCPLSDLARAQPKVYFLKASEEPFLEAT